jgi:hypothetical protein
MATAKNKKIPNVPRAKVTDPKGFKYAPQGFKTVVAREGEILEGRWAKAAVKQRAAKMMAPAKAGETETPPAE